MAAQLLRRHEAHCSDGLSRVRINGFPWTGRQKLREPEAKSMTFGSSPVSRRTRKREDWQITALAGYASLTGQPLAFSSHFSAFTPFTSSQRQREASPTKAGRRIVGNNRFAKAGAKISAKLSVR